MTDGRELEQGQPTLREILRRLNPNVPAGRHELAMPRVSRDSPALKQLRTLVSVDPHAKALLAGHIGVGKSTELSHLASEMSRERFVVECSMARKLCAHNTSAFALLIVILESCVRTWLDGLGDMPRGLVETLIGHLGSPLSKGEAKPSFFDELIGVSSRASGEPRSARELADKYDEVIQRLALRNVPDERIDGLDPSVIARSCEDVLSEMRQKAGKPVLLLIDDLDKVRDTRAQTDIFIDRAMAWQRLPCCVVATLPLDVLFSPSGPELDQVWPDAFILEPLPVPDLPGSGLKDPSLQTYLSMLRSIQAEDRFSALQCRRLAHLSNGLPRSFVHLCGSCVRYAIQAEDEHVRDRHIDLAEQHLRGLWQGRLSDPDYESLVAVLDSKGSNVPGALRLLRDGVLIHDRGSPREGEGAFRLAKWALPLVEGYRRRRSTKARP